MTQQNLPGTQPTITADALDLVRHIESRAEASQITVLRGDKDAVPVLVVPKGLDVRSAKPFLDEMRATPARRTGTATLTRLADFIAHVNRFKSADTMVFVNPETPSALAIYDYHPAGGDVFVAGNRGHGAAHTFPLSRAFRAWQNAIGRQMPQAEFAAFLTEHAAEVISPNDAPSSAADLGALDLTVGTADVLRRLARGLRVSVSEEAEDVHNLDNGDCVISFARKTTSTRDAKGEEIRVPGGFVIAVPVLDGDSAVTALPAILRFDRKGGAVAWTITLLHVAEVIERVIASAAERIERETGCPVLYGSPEK